MRDRVRPSRLYGKLVIYVNLYFSADWIPAGVPFVRNIVKLSVVLPEVRFGEPVGLTIEVYKADITYTVRQLANFEKCYSFRANPPHRNFSPVSSHETGRHFVQNL